MPPRPANPACLPDIFPGVDTLCFHVMIKSIEAPLLVYCPTTSGVPTSSTTASSVCMLRASRKFQY
jgi:hypothetical protein